MAFVSTDVGMVSEGRPCWGRGAADCFARTGTAH